VDNAKVGEVVWHKAGSDSRHQARIIDISGSAQPTVRLLTGPRSLQEFVASWETLEPCPEYPDLLGKAVKLYQVNRKLDGKN